MKLLKVVAELLGYKASSSNFNYLQMDAQNNLKAALLDASGHAADVENGGGDGVSNGSPGLVSYARKALFNETSWDRERGNTEVTVLASAARTVTGDSGDMTNHNAKGVCLAVNVTAVSGTSPTLTVSVWGKDPVSGAYYRITAETANITSIGLREIYVYPGAIDSAGGAEGLSGLPLPRTWRVNYTIGGTTPSFTFSVGGSYVV